MRFLFALLAMVSSSAAMAGTVFSPVSGDLSISMLLQPIFGSLFGGKGNGPLGDAMLIFNGCVLMVGGVLAAYTLVAGTAQTAHDGSILGAKWSSMWVPIRLVVGVAAVVPAGGAYCVAQLLVGWMAIQGIGLADSVWSAFATSSFASQSVASGTAPTPAVSRLAFGMLRSQVCMAGFLRMRTEGDASAILTLPPVTSGDFKGKRSYGVPGISPTVCGGVIGSDASGGAVATTAGFFGINTGAAEKAAAIRAAHASAAESMEGELHDLAVDIVNNSTEGAQARYIASIQAYQDRLAEVAMAQLGDQSYFAQLAKNASEDGWILAGSWFMRLIALQDAVMKALADAPTSLPVEEAPEIMANDVNRYYEALNGAVRDASKTGVDNQLLADRKREDSESGVVMSAINAVFNKINEGTTAGFNFLSDADAERHPVIVASAAGHQMIWYGLGLAVASVLVAKIGGTTIALVLGGFVMALLGAGASLAYFLPMLPFIIWIGACASWLLTVIEAVLGAPLWAIMHLNADGGDGLAGGARAGYMLILEMMLKPVLMVFGFCFAVLTSLPLGQLINRVFYSTFTLNQGGFVGFVGMLAAVGIYSALMLSMTKWTFSFIHKVPDQIFKWMGGGHGSGLAEGSSAAAAAAEHQSGAVVGAVGGAVAGAMTSRLNQMSQQTARHEEKQGGSGTEPEAAADTSGHRPEAKIAEQWGLEKEQNDKETERVTDESFSQSERQDSPRSNQ